MKIYVVTRPPCLPEWVFQDMDTAKDDMMRYGVPCEAWDNYPNNASREIYHASTFRGDYFMEAFDVIDPIKTSEFDIPFPMDNTL